MPTYMSHKGTYAGTNQHDYQLLTGAISSISIRLSSRFSVFSVVVWSSLSTVVKTACLGILYAAMFFFAR